MRALNPLVGILIHLVVPFLGVIAFAVLRWRMVRARIPSPPVLEWFVLFYVGGGWLLILLTVMFWEWSGMTSIGFITLLVMAPIATCVCAITLSGKRDISSYHRTAYRLCFGYGVAWCLLIMAVVVCGRSAP